MHTPYESHCRIEYLDGESLVPHRIEPVIRNDLCPVADMIIVRAHHLHLHKGRDEAASVARAQQVTRADDAHAQIQRLHAEPQQAVGVGGQVAVSEHVVGAQQVPAVTVVQELALCTSYRIE